MKSDLAVMILRLFAGIRLVYGVQDNVFSWKQMLHFSEFLDLHGFPQPLLAAVVSVYAQLLAGIMILVGWKIRAAALLMIINFLVALAMVYRGQGFEEVTAPMAMLVISVFLFLAGGGKYSLDGPTPKV